jgi:hypothetical protein
LGEAIAKARNHSARSPGSERREFGCDEDDAHDVIVAETGI